MCVCCVVLCVCVQPITARPRYRHTAPRTPRRAHATATALLRPSQCTSTDTNTDRHRDRHNYRQTHRHTHSHTHRETHTLTHTHLHTLGMGHVSGASVCLGSTPSPGRSGVPIRTTVRPTTVGAGPTPIAFPRARASACARARRATAVPTATAQTVRCVAFLAAKSCPLLSCSCTCVCPLERTQHNLPVLAACFSTLASQAINLCLTNNGNCGNGTFVPMLLCVMCVVRVVCMADSAFPS